MAAPPQRRALGALFLVLAVFFAGIAVTAAQADSEEVQRWVVSIAAAVLALWLGSLALRSFRRG